MAFTLFAQNGYDGAGYYRIKNRGEAGRYISIENDKVSEESKKISFDLSKSKDKENDKIKNSSLIGHCPFLSDSLYNGTKGAKGDCCCDEKKLYI